MIRNNLSILMSERNMKNSFLSAKTGISKNTISATSSNDGKMIQLETINKICQVLEVTPCEFFSYLPFDVDVKIFPDKISLEEKNVGSDELLFPVKNLFLEDLSFDVFMEKKSTKDSTDFLLTGRLIKPINLFGELPPVFSIVFNENQGNPYQHFWESIPLPFQKDIEKNIKELIKEEIGSYLADYPDSNDFDMANTIQDFLDTYFNDLTVTIDPY